MVLPAVSLFVTAGVLVCTMLAADMFTGTWRTNEAKSTPSNAPPPRESRVQKIEAVPDGLHVVQDGVDAEGHKEHSEWTVKFDGKQYPTKRTLDGKPVPDAEGETVAAKRIDDHTFEFTLSINGKVYLQARNVISADGKTRTASQTRTSPDGQKRAATVVFERQ
jgi:hypothetical protein